MRTSIISTLGLLSLSLVAVAQAPKWKPYSAAQDDFTILMPGPTQIQSQKTQGVTTRVYLSFGRPFVCAVTKTVLPASTRASDVAQMTSAMKTSMMAVSHSTATAVHSTRYGGLAGSQTDFKSPNGTGSVWTARTAHAVYSVMIAKQGGASAAEKALFFGSLRLR